MFKVWEGEAPKPIEETEWTPWLKAATQRVIVCNAFLLKEQNRLIGTQVKAHSKKIQLAEVQLQSEPTNEHVRGILHESQGRLAELFQTSIECHNHHSAMRWLRYGDTCSKLFFDFHCISKKRIFLKELEVDGRTISK